jgi:hypothetical protein
MDAKLFDGLAAKAYDSAMSEDQLKELIVSSNLVTGYGVEVLRDTSATKAYANSFGVGQYLDDKYWATENHKTFSWAEPLQKILKMKYVILPPSAFPGYATDRIKAGITVDSLASAYKGAIASVLERDADSVTFEDPRLRAALPTYVRS